MGAFPTKPGPERLRWKFGPLAVRVQPRESSVDTDREPPSVLVDCTCDAFEREGPCAHVWSVLLAAERTRGRTVAALSVEPLHAQAATWRPRTPEAISDLAGDRARDPAG